jgi:hypothetical protein
MYRVLALGVLAVAALPDSARAETTGCTAIESLPAVLTSQGVYCLNEDLGSASSTGAAIQILVNNITLDCNGHRLGGLAAGPATAAIGVRANRRANVTIRNCNIRGFQTGVLLEYGAGSGSPVALLVENNRLDGNTHRGIAVSGNGSVVRGNVVIDTGGNPLALPAEAIVARYGTDVVDNTVDGVADAEGAGANSTGIHAEENAGAPVQGNRVRGVTSSLAAWAYRSTGEYADVLFRDNVASLDPTEGSSIGFACATTSPTLARDNTSLGAKIAFNDCVDGGGNVALTP